MTFRDQNLLACCADDHGVLSYGLVVAHREATQLTDEAPFQVEYEAEPSIMPGWPRRRTPKRWDF